MMTTTSSHAHRSHGRSLRTLRYRICLDALIHWLGGKPGPEVQPLYVQRIRCHQTSDRSLTPRSRPGARSITMPPTEQVQIRAATKRAVPRMRCAFLSTPEKP